MPKYLIADFVTEFTPKYDNLTKLAEPFLYHGDRETQIRLSVSDARLNSLLKRFEKGATLEIVEEFAYASAFYRKIIPLGAMLVHSSAIVCRGEAYLFSAPSQTGKSTHTRLWKQAFGSEVEYINDDKPIVRIIDGKAVACGTPFDGGSKIANNISAPLKAIIFLERAETNSVSRIESTAEILRRLYTSTSRHVNEKDADIMLQTFEKLIGAAEFYLLRCNMDISAAYTARNAILK